MLAFYLRRTIPLILNDVGESIGEQLSGLVEKPAVKQAMTMMGNKSGEVRADKALRKKAADKMLDTIPSLKMVLEQLDITPIEGLQLLNDPLVGPWIRGFLDKGLTGLFSGGGSAPGGRPPHNSGGKIPSM